MIDCRQLLSDIRFATPYADIWRAYCPSIGYEAARKRFKLIEKFDDGSKSEDEILEYVAKVMRLRRKTKVALRKKILSQETIDEIRSLVESGVSKEEIARRVGINISTLYYHMQRDSRKSLSDETIDEIFRLHNEGMKQVNIASELGISKNRVWYHLNIIRE